MNDSRQAEKWVNEYSPSEDAVIKDFIVSILSLYLNLSLVILGVFAMISIEYEKEMTRFQYEMDYLCSQSKHIVGYSEGGALIMETLYVSCESENEVGHNFTRVPHVEKKYSETLL